jgi:4-phytase/acid phosphatase
MTRKNIYTTSFVQLLALLIMATVGVPPIYAQKKAEAPDTVKFVLILSRHGVCSPTGSVEQLNQYSSQPWPKWNVPPGYLTPHGARLMNLFGTYYRSYYAQQGLFTARGCADAAHVSFYSDSDQRTVETGKSLIAGMFPGCDDKQPEHHFLAEGEGDPLFHSLSAGLGKPDRDRAVASIAGLIGADPDGVTEAYRAQLEALQRILLACPSSTPCPSPGHTAAKPLLAIPASLDGGKSDHLAELKDPLNTASTITENFLLEFADGMPMDQVAWGRVDLPTLKQLIDLHTAASDLTRRTSYLATVQASNTLAHILQTLEQAETGKAVPGALGKAGDKTVVLVGHDTNLTNIAGTLNLNWLLDGRRDDTPPGGSLVFELRQHPGDSLNQVYIYYVAQTLEQMRSLTPLNLDTTPAKASIFLPGCSSGAVGYPCEWTNFSQVLKKVINPEFVK